MNVEEIMDQELGQAAFSAYVDAAQSEGHVHERLTAGSYAAARAVIGRLIERGAVRSPLVWEAAHGTYSGYTGGCRCEFCRDAGTVYSRAFAHYKQAQGHNKISA